MSRDGVACRHVAGRREMSSGCRKMSRRCREDVAGCRGMSRDVVACRHVAGCRGMSSRRDVARCREDVAKISRRCREVSRGVAKVSQKCRKSVAKVSQRCHQMSPSVNLTSHFIKCDDMTTHTHEAGGCAGGDVWARAVVRGMPCSACAGVVWDGSGLRRARVRQGGRRGCSG